MNNKSIVPAMCLALLSTTALAGDITLNIGATATPIINITPSTTNAPIEDYRSNTGPTSSTIGVSTIPESIDINLNLGNLTGGTNVIDNESFSAVAAANANKDSVTNQYSGDNINTIIFAAGTAYADAEALIGTVNLNSGTVTALIESGNLNIDGDDLAGATIGVSNVNMSSLAVINGQSNYISGDASSRAVGGLSTNTAGINTSGALPGIVTANADLVIAALQHNASTGVAKSTIQNIDKTIDVSNLDAASSMTHQGQDIVAETEVNFLVNSIDVDHLGTDLDFVIAAAQVNEAEANTLVDEIDMSMTVSDSLLGDSTMSHMKIAALTTVNNMVNVVDSVSGSADGNITVFTLQDNDGAVNSTVSNLDMYMDGQNTLGTEAVGGNMTTENIDIDASASANIVNTYITTDTSGDGAIDVNLDQHNSGAITGLVTTLDLSMLANTALSGAMAIENSDVAAFAYANVANNYITNASNGSGDVDVGVAQTNTGVIDAATKILDMSMSADDGALTGGMSLANNNVAALAYANVSYNRSIADEGGMRNINLDIAQSNEESVLSTVNDVTGTLEAGTSATTITGDMSVMNNTVTANAAANTVYNDITFGNSSGSASSIKVNQSNTAAVTALISLVDIGVTANGTTSSSFGIRNNSFSASAVANSATNIIRLN